MPVSDEEYQTVLDNLKWSHALLSVLIEQDGGVVELAQHDVETYSLGGRIQVELDPEQAVYTVTVIPATIDGEIVD